MLRDTEALLTERTRRDSLVADETQRGLDARHVQLAAVLELLSTVLELLEETE